MQYVKNVLRSYADDRPLSEYANKDALMQLVAAFNEKAVKEDDLSEVTMQTTVGEFKEALSKLDTADKVQLLYLYSVGFDVASTTEDVEKREARKLKHWLIRASVYAFAPIPPLIVGAAIVIGVRSGGLPDNAAFSSIISLAGEVLKLVIGGAL